MTTYDKPQSKLKLKVSPPGMLALAFGFFCLLTLAAKLFSENYLPSPVEQPAQVSQELQKLQNLFVSGQVVKAKKGLIEYIKNHPDEALAHSLLGQAYSLVGSHSLAIDHLEIAAALEPENSRHYFLLASVYKALGWAELEERQYTQILINEPDNLSALASRMEVNFLLGNYALMLEDAKFAISAHPRDPRAYFLHGRMKMLTGSFDEAKESFKFVEANGSTEQRAAVRQWQQQIDAAEKR